MHMECSATKSSSRAHRRFSLHGQNTTPSVSFFSRGSFRPKKYFPTARFESYLLSTLPSLPLFLSFSLSPSLLKFAHEFISRSTGWRTRNPGSPVCVCVGFGAGSILISIQSRTISSGSTFEENERTRVRAPPFNPHSSLCSAGWPSVAIFEYSESGKNYVNQRIPRSRRWKVEGSLSYMLSMNRGKVYVEFFFLLRNKLLTWIFETIRNIDDF